MHCWLTNIIHITSNVDWVLIWGLWVWWTFISWLSCATDCRSQLTLHVQVNVKKFFFPHANQNQLVYSILKFISKLNKQPVISILFTSLVTCTTLKLSKRLSKSHFKNYQLKTNYCCAVSVASEQQHKQDLRKIHRRETNSQIDHFLPECIAFNQTALCDF